MSVKRGDFGRSHYEGATDAMLASMQPGDGTVYDFMWAASREFDFYHVAGTPGFAMYEYSKLSILNCYEECKAGVSTGRLPQTEWVDDDGKTQCQPHHYIAYVADHSRCNMYTAWAMVQCLAEFWIRQARLDECPEGMDEAYAAHKEDDGE